MKKSFLLSACLILMISLAISCKKDDATSNGYSYAKPAVFEDGLETASLESVGMKTTPIVSMMNYLNSNSSHTIHNILIIKDKKLVFEEYFIGYKLSYSSPDLNGELINYSRTFDHPMQSISKSVTSVIFGIAVKNGYFPDLNKKIIDYFPEYADVLTGEKANITIHHLLTMTSGIAWDESTYPIGDTRNDITQLFASEDPMRFILSKPLLTSPGATFSYNSGSTNVVGAIIEKATGMGFLNFANQYLFDPLQSEGGAWSGYSNGQIHASGGLYFKARELCKIGLLFLNEGMWEDQQVITPEWITKSQERHVSSTVNFFPNSGYGYYWWLTEFSVNGITQECFFAAGWGDQYMFIIPGLDLIIEFNSGNYNGTSNISPFDLVNNYILRSIE
ncbi:MAG: class C beta-lactamase-related serine hydrolase [Bacteroidales bacterium]|nr:MAG: class C beta-lactamase-related serine hydrolase [Bacteroidales bacterium]